jgi:SAM-dependent methyltransferase
MSTTVEVPKKVLDKLPRPKKGFEVTVDRSGNQSGHPHDIYISTVSGSSILCGCVDWLDVGCGWHLDFPWEQDREKELMKGVNVVGIDPDWQAIARHRSITRRTVGSVERLPFIDRCFDMVTANVVVEHLKYPSLAFSEMFRVLRAGGCLVFRTPSARGYFVRIARVLPQGLKVHLATGIIENRDPEDIYPAHYRANTTELIAEICRIVGFRKLEITVTRARGVLGKFPRLQRVERSVMAAFRFTEGNLIVRAWK